MLVRAIVNPRVGARGMHSAGDRGSSEWKGGVGRRPDARRPSRRRPSSMEVRTVAAAESLRRGSQGDDYLGSGLISVVMRPISSLDRATI